MNVQECPEFFLFLFCFCFFIVLVIEGVWQGTVNREADLLS